MLSLFQNEGRKPIGITLLSAKMVAKATTKKGELPPIEVVNVNKDNFRRLWPEILIQLKKCNYLAIDLELSGLGDLHKMRTKNIQDRYVVQREAVTTRSVLSIGLAFFTFDGQHEDERRLNFASKIFNILTLCSQGFTMEPDAMRFLASHSFDFNRLVASGVSYSPSTRKGACPIRSLFTEIFSSGRPLFFHNGLTDVLFVYHHFYSPLPATWPELINALSDLFTSENSPICDSKYLMEFIFRTKATFLEYVFRKSQRENWQEARDGRYHIEISFPKSPNAEDIEAVSCSLPANFPSHPIPANIEEIVCSSFANHGFCSSRIKGICKKSHDVDKILDLEWKKSEKERLKKKRKYDHLKTESIRLEEKEKSKTKAPCLQANLEDIDAAPRNLSVTGCHRAGVDAFMTGFAILFNERVHLWRNQRIDPKHLNRLPLSGKAEPFVIQPTHSAGNCALHQERFQEIFSRRQHSDLL